MAFIYLTRISNKMRMIFYILIFLLSTASAFAQSGSRLIQSSDVTGALGYTPLQSIGAMTGPAINCGSGLVCSANTISASGGTATAGGTNGQVQYNNAGVLGGFTLSGDCTLTASTGVIVCTKSNNVSFGTAAFVGTGTSGATLGLLNAANTWSATQSLSSLTLSSITGSTQCLHVDTSGVVSGTGSDCGSGGGSGITQLTGDVTAGPGTGSQAATLASVIAAGGPTGSATVAPVITYDAKGRLTAVSSATITPAIGSVTGLGTGVATFLATPSSANLRAALTDETGTGVAYFVGGALGTPSSATLTNATGLPVAGISAIAADTVVANATGGSASPSAVTIGSCSSASNALTYNTTTHAFGCNTISGAGDVVGPASATDKAVARFNLTTGKLIQSGALISADTTGALSRSGGGGVPIQGTNTNNSASAGDVGEYVEANVANPGSNVTTNTGSNITSISLTAGDWIVAGTIGFNGAGTTTVNYVQGSISQTSATIDQSNGRAYNNFYNNATVYAQTQTSATVGPIRASLSATTTVYLVCVQVFAVSTASCYGHIRAWRIR